MAIKRRARKTRRNPEMAEEFPIGEYVPVEAVKVNEDGTINVVIKDSQMDLIIEQENRHRARMNPRRNKKRRK